MKSAALYQCLYAAALTAFAPLVQADAPRIHRVAVSPAQGEAVRQNTGNIERSFIEDMARAGLAEIDASKLALERSTRPEVKQYAQHMIDEHTKSQGQLKAVADGLGIRLPENTSVHQKARLQRLRALSGTKFEQRFANDYGVVAHQKAVALARRTVSQTQSTPVKELASQMLPQLEQHLLMGRELQAALTSRSSGNTRREGQGGPSMPPPGSPSLEKPPAKADRAQ